MEETREGDWQEEVYDLQQKVWAKIIGYPWWPAMVTQLPNARTTAYRVDFFNDHTHAFLPAHKLAKYHDMRVDIDLHRHMNKGLRKAIAEADKAVAEQRPLLLVPLLPTAPVEVCSNKQKQLLQSSPTPTHLQENNKVPGHSLPQQHPSQHSVLPLKQSEPEQEQPEQQQPEQQELQQQQLEQPMPSLQRPLVLPHLSYSHQEREKYITALLKKYRLVNIPKADEYVALPPSNRRTMAGRRPGAGRKANDHKNKVIRKLPSQQQTYLYLLTRKLQSLLKGKDGLDPQQRRQISTSLSLQVLGGGGTEEVAGLLKWVAISPAQTIANFYQNWGCLQGEKEKTSNMTTEE